MKPPPFDYVRPGSVQDALGVLARLGTDGKVLAGGQSLVPLLSMRLAAPHCLVDINRLTELSYVRVDAGGVRVGALARHAAVERSSEAAAAVPLLAEAMAYVAHPTIRNRGTTVGSLVHADPAGELTAVLAVLGGSVRLASAGGVRDVAATDFFVGPLESALAPGELALEAFFPRPVAGAGTAFCEVARRHGDYAVCGVAAVVAPRAVDVALLAVAPTPLVVHAGDPADAVPAVDAAIEAAGGTVGDIHASADYRRHLALVLTERAVRLAGERAAGPVAA